MVIVRVGVSDMVHLRPAGVGIATLYRSFPTRADLMEFLYMASVDQ